MKYRRPKLSAACVFAASWLALPVALNASDAGAALFGLEPLSFELSGGKITPSTAAEAVGSGGGGGQVDDFGDGPSWGTRRPDVPLRVDFLFGAFIPFEDSGMAFGETTANENFDVGGIFGIRVQAWVFDYLRIGGEIDFSAHDVEGGDVFFPGELGRIYFMVPISLEWTFGPERTPSSLGFTVSPGFQVALPDVDELFEDLQILSGRFVQQDDFVAFTLRTSVAYRISINSSLRFFVQTSYDWALGNADVRVRNVIGQVLESRSGQIDMSGLSAMFGFSFVF